MSILYLRSALSDISLGTNNTNKAGGAVAWRARALTDTVSTTANVTATVGSINGLTNGLETGAPVNEWISEPLAAAVTISGTITFNICGLESNAMANAGLGVVVQRINNVGTVVSTIVDSVQNVELGTSNSRRTWTATPTSTAMQKGDRFRIRVYFDDAGGTMVSGYTLTLTYDGTAANTGNSNVDFAETLTFMSSTPAYAQMKKLTAEEFAQGNGQYGYSVALSASGSVLVVGAFLENTTVADAGAVYVYSDQNYNTRVKLQATDPAELDGFGSSVACSQDGSVIVVGAFYKNQGGIFRGAVYVFSGSNYSVVQKLTPSDAADYDFFGHSVACSSDGSIVVVGAPTKAAGALVSVGAVYVFSGANYATQLKLTASDADENDQFGWAVACSADGSRVIVGAINETNTAQGIDRGAVYVRSGANYATSTKLIASDAVDGNQFGWDVACTDDGLTVFVASRSSGNLNPIRGAAYVYSGANYVTQTKVVTNNGLQDDVVTAVACSPNGSVLLIGSTGVNGAGIDCGAIYVCSGAAYTTQTQLVATDPQDGADFGDNIAVSKDMWIVAAGAPGVNDNSFSQGAAYVFSQTGTLVFPTATVSDIADQGASVTELTAWTSRGNG